jgi:hypothetical protein
MKAFILAIFISLSAIISAKADNTAVHPDIDYDTAMEMLQAGNYLDALKSFGLSAKKGNQDAQYQIGLMFLEGQGVSASAEDAAYWFRKAAQNGHAASQFEIGYCFATGAGVQSDERIAAEWFWRAAEQGDPDAAFYLARMYRDGRGIQKNIEKARKYYKMAAGQGLPEAQEELSQLPPPPKTVQSHKNRSKSSIDRSDKRNPGKRTSKRNKHS